MFYKFLLDPIKKYFKRTRNYSKPRFIIELALVPFLINLFLTVVWNLLTRNTQAFTAAIGQESPIELFFKACILAPAVETVLFQWIPIWIASFFTKSLSILLTVSVLLFVVEHLHRGFGGILMALSPGIFFAGSFLVKRQISRWEAYWTTTAIHSFHNLVVLLFNYSAQSLFS